MVQIPSRYRIKAGKFKINSENWTILKNRVVQLHHLTRPNAAAGMEPLKLNGALLEVPEYVFLEILENGA